MSAAIVHLSKQIRDATLRQRQHLIDLTSQQVSFQHPLARNVTGLDSSKSWAKEPVPEQPRSPAFSRHGQRQKREAQGVNESGRDGGRGRQVVGVEDLMEHRTKIVFAGVHIQDLRTLGIGVSKDGR
ncbi:hypothetical protein A4X09_0g2768 [Tilletia walkeri]|uniref:Uncharacterized protein n=1 Tax=Tilletia walkeri TaxID=117179 RepID=A0A8X7NC72_9BASI|nr:hypothetical protein A4X09_0g2768 [Tilletia walkeri]